MPRNTGGRRASKTNVSLSTPGGGSVINHKPNYDLMKINNIKVHQKAEIQQAEIKNKLVVPITDNSGNSPLNVAPKLRGELVFDTSSNHLFIGDISSDNVTLQWLKIELTGTHPI
tara:strand:+ start:120 stop:464 length:345 start_codon:yes stop_codon:yes gene_type:complete